MSSATISMDVLMLFCCGRLHGSHRKLKAVNNANTNAGSRIHLGCKLVWCDVLLCAVCVCVCLLVCCVCVVVGVVVVAVCLYVFVVVSLLFVLFWFVVVCVCVCVCVCWCVCCSTTFKSVCSMKTNLGNIPPWLWWFGFRCWCCCWCCCWVVTCCC